MLNTMTLKAIGETKIAYELCKRGIKVYKPIIDDVGVDFIIDNGKLLKIQVKCCNAPKTNKTYQVQLANVGYNRTQIKCRIKTYKASDVDIFAIYFYDIDKVCFFKVSDYEGKKHMAIRQKCNQPKNNQQYRQTWIEDHFEIPEI